MAFDLAKSGFGERGEMSNLDKIKMIPLDDIVKNDHNFYSMSSIDELAESIEMVGLLNPVSVVEADGKYRLVSGHRRCEAYYKLWLGADPASDDGKRYSKVPAIVLRGMDDLKETFALITANSTSRELTYSEKLQQEKTLRETLTSMKAAGMTVPRNLGQYIADQIGVSRNEVSRMHSVNENLIPKAREKVDAGDMTAKQAYELSRKPEAEQHAEMSNSNADLVEYSDLSDSLDRLEDEIIIKKMTPSMRMLAEEVAGAGSKSEAVAIIKQRLRYSGGVNHLGQSGGCCFGDPGKQTACISWPKIYDYLALYAIRKLASKSDYDDSEPECGHMDTEWQTGTPTESGEYVAIFDLPGMMFKRICYYDNVHDKWHMKRFGVVIEEKCLKWFHIPDLDF